jgi:hypothetical protein
MLCLTNLKDGKSVPQSLRLLARIFGKISVAFPSAQSLVTNPR